MMIYEVFMAFLGNTVYSAGVILQKKGSVWMNCKKEKSGRFIAMLLIWASGILLSYVLSTLPIGIASKKLPPQIISAMAGWNIAAVVLLSALFLNEKVRKKDILYTVLIVGAIALINLYGRDTVLIPDNCTGLCLLMAIPFLLVVPVLLRLVNGKIKVGLLSVFSGTMGGLTLVLMNLLVKENGASLGSLLSSRYLLLYFGAGLASLSALQSAYRIGNVMLITPVQTSVSIIYPFICSYFLFNSCIGAVQLISTILIVISCFGLLKNSIGKPENAEQIKSVRLIAGKSHS